MATIPRKVLLSSYSSSDTAANFIEIGKCFVVVVLIYSFFSGVTIALKYGSMYIYEYILNDKFGTLLLYEECSMHVCVVKTKFTIPEYSMPFILYGP